MAKKHYQKGRSKEAEVEALAPTDLSLEEIAERTGASPSMVRTVVMPYRVLGRDPRGAKEERLSPSLMARLMRSRTRSSHLARLRYTRRASSLLNPTAF